MRVYWVLVGVLTLALCGCGSDEGTSLEGESCASTGDCRTPLRCLEQVCVAVVEPGDVTGRVEQYGQLQLQWCNQWRSCYPNEPHDLDLEPGEMGCSAPTGSGSRGMSWTPINADEIACIERVAADHRAELDRLYDCLDLRAQHIIDCTEGCPADVSPCYGSRPPGCDNLQDSLPAGVLDGFAGCIE